MCRARLAIQEAFGPSYTVVSVPARAILLGGGNIHCMTMQQAQAGQAGTHLYANGATDQS